MLVGVLLGTTVGDAANILSCDYPPSSTRVTAATRSMLAAVIIGVGLSGFSAPPAMLWEILAAALLTTGAVLIPWLTPHPPNRPAASGPWLSGPRGC